MDEHWIHIAERVVDALGVQDGEVVQLRDRTGRFDVLQELLLEIERRGATPLPLILHAPYLQRLLESTDPAILAGWDRRRIGWLEATDRVLVLAGADGDLSAVPPDAAGAWGQAVERLTRAEDSRRLPYLLAAIPTTARAEQLGMSLRALEDLVVPALLAQPSELRQEVDRVLAAMDGARMLTIRSGASCELHIELGDRAWLRDTGAMPAPDSLALGVRAVQNLPAGAVYTTVVEAAASGALWLPEAAGAREVTLHFDAGRIVTIEAAHGAEELDTMFDQHTGEPRQPYRHRPQPAPPTGYRVDPGGRASPRCALDRIRRESLPRWTECLVAEHRLCYPRRGSDRGQPCYRRQGPVGITLYVPRVLAV